MKKEFRSPGIYMFRKFRYTNRKDVKKEFYVLDFEKYVDIIILTMEEIERIGARKIVMRNCLGLGILKVIVAIFVICNPVSNLHDGQI